MNKEERILKYINTADELTFSGKRYYENDFYNDVENLVKENQELKKENKILRENAEHNDKVVDKVNWENQSLKKQLEENKNKINWYENFEINKTIDKLRIKHKNQQKEFIDYLENMLDNENDIFSVVRVKDVLSKYKEIIGD